MKRALIISLGLLILVSSVMATDTRVMTMGQNNNILLDEANIWLYPSRINYYPDLAEMELVNYGDDYYPFPEGELEGVSPIERVGVNMKFGGDKPYVIGLYLHNQAEYYHQFSPISGRSHGSFNDEGYYGNSNRRADLFYGRKLGDKNFGLRFGYVHSSYKNLSANQFNETSFSQISFDLGLTLKEGLFDIMVGLESFSFTDLQTVNLNQGLSGDASYGGVDNYEPDGNKRLYFRARYFHELNSTVTVVPHLGFSTGTYKWNEWDWLANPAPDSGFSNQVDRTSKTTSKEFTLGTGLHYTPSSKVLTVIDFGLATTKIKRLTSDNGEISESSENWTALPFIKLGFEAGVFKWLDVRFGAETYWAKYTVENVENATKSVYKYPDNRNYLGFGFHWGQFHVDTYANPALFTNGFDFISGDSTNDMNFKISAVYEMH